jgi:hypothetical protein
MKKFLLAGSLFLTLSGGSVFAIPPAYEGEFSNPVVEKHYRGDVVEEFTKRFFEAEGWKPVDAKVGNSGIDNLFIKTDKNGNVRDVLIVESKANSSTLGTTKGKGVQMSKEWILRSLDEKIKQLERDLSKTTDPRKAKEIEKQLKILRQVRALVEKNNYRARLLELKHLGGKKFELILKEIPAGITAQELAKIKNQLKVKVRKIIDLNKNDKLARILKSCIKEITESYTKIGKFTRASTLRKTLAKAPFKAPNIAKTLSMIKKLKVATFAKEALNAIPVIGSIIAAGAQIGYDIYVANVLERLAKEHELLGKQIQLNSQKIAELALRQEALAKTQQKLISQVSQLALTQKQIMFQVANLADSLTQVKTQIAEIKRGIFVTGLELLKNYFVTGDLAYLNEAIAQLITARNVKNPKLEPIITLYLVNAYAEKFHRVKNIKEVQLIKKEFRHLADLVSQDSKNIKLLLTAYQALADIPLEEKNQILREAVLKVIDQKLKGYLFEDALTLAENYASLTGDKSLYSLVLRERLENYNRYRHFQNPAQALEIVKKYQNSLLVKEAVKYLYRNNYFNLALEVLNSKDTRDETFQIGAYLSIFSYLGDTDRVQKLIRLVEENPTYLPTTKRLVAQFKTIDVGRVNTKETFNLSEVLSF